MVPNTADAPAGKRAEINQLELSPEPDAGGDPYNRTGQFLIDEIRKYEE